MQPRIRNNTNVVLRMMWFKNWHSEGKLMWFTFCCSFCQCKKFRRVDMIILWILHDFIFFIRDFALIRWTFYYHWIIKWHIIININIKKEPQQESTNVVQHHANDLSIQSLELRPNLHKKNLDINMLYIKTPY